MKAFMDQDFLLTTDTAKRLFHEVAEGLPIYDYHCHLDPKEIYEGKSFQNIVHLFSGAVASAHFGMHEFRYGSDTI